jgi:hypothetical protein
VADTATMLAEIERLYYKASKQTIHEDFARAIDLLKQLPDEETRAKAHVYMEGLAEMRSEWQGAEKGRAASPRRPRR